MKKGETRISRGFTIVEVALVIAVAGLIFIMVFLAVPALRASERDTERREDITFLLESIKKYQTNNRGTLPSDTEERIERTGDSLKEFKDKSGWAGFYGKYLGESYIDPSGNYYILDVRKCGDNAPEDKGCTKGNDEIGSMDYTLYIFTSAKCDGSDAVKSSNPRKVAVRYRLKGSGIFCQST